MKNILVILFIAFFVSCGFSGIYDSLAIKAITAAGQNSENIGFVVRNVNTGNEIVSLNGDKKFIPASLQKLFTGAAAFDKLGTNFRTETKIYAENFDRKTGEIKGDLTIVGAGDAGISAERLWLLAQYLRHLGVKSINNRLVVDNSLFADETAAPGYGESDNSRAYMAPISAFAVSFNATSVVVSPSAHGEKANIHLFPSREDVQMSGTITTAQSGKEFSVITKKHSECGMEVILGGIVKPTDKPKYIYRQVWEPVINAAETFRAVAKEVGINADFSVAIGKIDPSKSELILSFDSEPLSVSINGMFKYSNNFTAEMVFLTLAAQTTKKQANFESGSLVIQNWWKEKFTQSGEISVINGSGMGARNQASARQIADLLDWSSKQDWSYEYIAALPIAGIDGTLASRFKNSVLKGNLRAKTGTLNDLGVSNLAGYFRANGELYSVVFIANDKTSTQYAKWVLGDDLISNIKKTIEKTGK